MKVNDHTHISALISQVEFNRIYRMEYIFNIFEYQRTKRPALGYNFTDQQLCEAIQLLPEYRKPYSSDVEVIRSLEEIIEIAGRMHDNQTMLRSYPEHKIRLVRNTMHDHHKIVFRMKDYAAMLIALNIDNAATLPGAIDGYGLYKTVRLLDSQTYVNFIEQYNEGALRYGYAPFRGA